MPPSVRRSGWTLRRSRDHETILAISRRACARGRAGRLGRQERGFWRSFRISPGLVLTRSTLGEFCAPACGRLWPQKLFEIRIDFRLLGYSGKVLLSVSSSAPVESRGGISPPRAPKTVREPLSIHTAPDVQPFP